MAPVTGRSITVGSELPFGVGIAYALAKQKFDLVGAVREGRLAADEAPPPTLESRAFGWFVGGTALLLGIVAIVLIVYSIFH